MSEAQGLDGRNEAQSDPVAYRRILVAFDGSAGSLRALQVALSLARGYTATVSSVTVQHHLPRFGATVGEVDEERLVLEQQARRIANEVQAHAVDSGVAVVARVRPGHPGQEIVREATETGADLIVMGHSGHSAIHDRLLGSVAESVSRHAHCSVLIAR